MGWIVKIIILGAMGIFVIKCIVEKSIGGDSLVVAIILVILSLFSAVMIAELEPLPTFKRQDLYVLKIVLDEYGINDSEKREMFRSTITASLRPDPRPFWGMKLFATILISPVIVDLFSKILEGNFIFSLDAGTFNIGPIMPLYIVVLVIGFVSVVLLNVLRYRLERDNSIKKDLIRAIDEVTLLEKIENDLKEKMYLEEQKCMTDKGNNYEAMEAEYQMLHNEIMSNAADSLKITSTCVPVAVAALGFAVEFEKYWITAVVFVFASIMISIQLRYRKSTFRNATYCEVFLEPELGRKWETRLRKMQENDENKRNENGDNGKHGLKKILNRKRLRFLEWILIEVVAWVMFISMQTGTFFDVLMEPINIVISIVFLTVFVSNIADVVSITNRPKQKKVDYDKWKKIKDEEMNCK